MNSGVCAESRHEELLTPATRPLAANGGAWIHLIMSANKYNNYSTQSNEYSRARSSTKRTLTGPAATGTLSPPRHLSAPS
jgi:hypothetical protein